jgi:uncharacterized membrane protein
MTKAKNYWNSLIATLWFVPTLLVAGGIILAFFFVGIDYFIGDQLGYFPRLFGVQPSGARDMLAVIAGSAITVAGTAFSITIVALTLASTQFSPRVLRNFMRDTGNQVVLGLLVGVFAYCIIVLRTIRDSGDNDSFNDFVPSVAVIFGVILGLVAIGSLIYYIHHIAASIQATSIISLIAEETIKEIRKTFPVLPEEIEIDKQTNKRLEGKNFLTVNSDMIGYVQNADTTELAELAARHDLILKMQRRIGQFTIKDLPLLFIFPNRKDFKLSPELKNKLRDTYDIGTYRTVEGDVAFGLRQIVDIALKALSPSINDSTTAVTCVDYLTAILSTLGKRPSCPSNVFINGNLRLIIEQQKFEDFFDLAFNQIRQNAGGNVAVILRQLNSINILSKINIELVCEDERAERHELMKNQAALLYELAKRSVKAEQDLETVTRYYNRVQKSLAEREEKIL